MSYAEDKAIHDAVTKAAAYVELASAEYPATKPDNDDLIGYLTRLGSEIAHYGGIRIHRDEHGDHQVSVEGRLPVIMVVPAGQIPDHVEALALARAAQAITSTLVDWQKGLLR